MGKGKGEWPTIGEVFLVVTVWLVLKSGLDWIGLFYWME